MTTEESSIKENKHAQESPTHMTTWLTLSMHKQEWYWVCKHKQGKLVVN
jgi:hypothetical protein